MTCHRLVRCRVSDLLDQAASRHPLSLTGSPPAGGRRWFPHGGPPGGAAVCWSAAVPGPQHGRLVWWLEIEQGARAVLAHLTVRALDRTWPVPGRMSQLALSAWSAHELAWLAREAEAAAGDRPPPDAVRVVA